MSTLINAATLAQLTQGELKDLRILVALRNEWQQLAQEYGLCPKFHEWIVDAVAYHKLVKVMRVIRGYEERGEAVSAGLQVEQEELKKAALCDEGTTPMQECLDIVARSTAAQIDLIDKAIEE